MGNKSSKDAGTPSSQNTIPSTPPVKKTFTEEEIKKNFTVEAINKSENSGQKNVTRPQTSTNVSKSDSIKLIMDAEKKREDAEALLVQSSAVSLVASITQAAAVGAIVGSGPALPAVAAVAIVIGAFLALKAGHKTLIAALRLYYDKFIAAYNFIELSELVISKMQVKTGKKYDFKNAEVNLFASQFNLLLRSIAPPSVMKLIEDAKEKAERAKPKSTGYVARINKFFSKTSGTATRVIYSGYYTDQVITKFQEFLNACQTYQSRAFFYFLENTDVFEDVMDEVHADPIYQKIYMATDIEPEKLVEKASTNESSISTVAIAELQNRVRTIEEQTSQRINIVDAKVATDLATALGETPKGAEQEMDEVENKEQQAEAETQALATAVTLQVPPIAAATGNGANRPATAASATGVTQPAANANNVEGNGTAAASVTVNNTPKPKTQEEIGKERKKLLAEFQKTKDLGRRAQITEALKSLRNTGAANGPELPPVPNAPLSTPSPTKTIKSPIEFQNFVPLMKLSEGITADGRGGTRRNKLHRRKQKTRRQKRQQRK